jgi:hypothetical protein
MAIFANLKYFGKEEEKFWMLKECTKGKIHDSHQ